jgi:uncharacterized membrane protein YesL
LEFKGVMGGFYRISEWVMRLAVINLLWILCSIPVFFIAGNAYLVLIQTGDASTMLSSLPLLAILAPFTLFPATAAMFTVARKWVTGDGDVPLLKTFFRGYKENYVKSLVGGFLFMLIFFILYVNYRFYVGQGSALRALSIIFIAFTFVITSSMFNFFSIMVHLHMKALQIIKNSVLISLGNPLNSLILIIGNGLIVYFSLFQFTFLIPFFMGSLVAAFSFWQFHRSFQKLQIKQQQLADKDALREEEESVQQKNASQTDFKKQAFLSGTSGGMYNEQLEENNKRKS